MSATLEQLRCLRTQAGLAASPTRLASAPTPATPAYALRALMQRHRGLALCAGADERDLPGVEISAGVRYIESLVSWLPLPETIDTTFAQRIPVASHIAARQVLAFDTETTGLAGGTGTRAFMIGAADCHEGSLRLRQLLITTMAAETEMLREFARWCNGDNVLVSYNGRCYDAPLLATRYRLARMSNPLAGLAHLDLLHPTRRRWRGVYENCRLATIERHVLGVLREDDLPGAEAPAAWLSYLRGGSSKNLCRVVTHNATDLTSLTALLLRLGDVDASTATHRSAPKDHDLPPGNMRRSVASRSK